MIGVQNLSRDRVLGLFLQYDDIFESNITKVLFRIALKLQEGFQYERQGEVVSLLNSVPIGATVLRNYVVNKLLK